MTEKEKIMAAIAAAGDALKKMFPDVDFRITAEGDEPEEKKGNPLEELLNSLNIKAPAALRTPAAHVELFQGENGKLDAACAEPNEDLIEQAVNAIFADELDEDCMEDCACHNCPDCEGGDGCIDDGEDSGTFEPECIPDSECSMINIYFDNEVENVQVSCAGNASETRRAAAVMHAALDLLPDWPDEKWQDFLDNLEELAWMLERIDE